MRCSCVGGGGLERKETRVPSPRRRVLPAVTNASEKATELRSVKGPLESWQVVGESCNPTGYRETQAREGWGGGTQMFWKIIGASCNKK